MEIDKSRSFGKRGRGTPNWNNSSRSHSWSIEEVFPTANHSRSSSHAEDDEEALKLAALERLSTFDRLRTNVLESYVVDFNEEKVGMKKVDLMNENECFINKLLNVVEEDNSKLLNKIKDRYDKFVLTNSSFQCIYISFFYTFSPYNLTQKHFSEPVKQTVPNYGK